MLLLALDASTPVVTVAVARVEDGERLVLSEVSSTGGASETLLQSVRCALDLGGARLEEMGRILVGVGPGTFTSVRIAVATARSLSFSTGVLLAKNGTLDALAAPALQVSEGVMAILDARRGEVFARRPGGELLCEKPERIAERAPLLVGDGAVRYREVLSGLGSIPPDDSPLHRVTATGHVLCADLTPVDLRDLVPTYVREPDAKVRREISPWSRP
jgi:tRNA threonylcarbamoyladenosine biosynthesis protein TsaB